MKTSNYSCHCACVSQRCRSKMFGKMIRFLRANMFGRRHLIFCPFMNAHVKRYMPTWSTGVSNDGKSACTKLVFGLVRIFVEHSRLEREIWTKFWYLFPHTTKLLAIVANDQTILSVIICLDQRPLESDIRNPKIASQKILQTLQRKNRITFCRHSAASERDSVDCRQCDRRPPIIWFRFCSSVDMLYAITPSERRFECIRKYSEYFSANNEISISFTVRFLSHSHLHIVAVPMADAICFCELCGLNWRAKTENRKTELRCPIAPTYVHRSRDLDKVAM